MKTDIQDILAERGEEYGKFLGHAEITQRLKEVINDELVKRNKALDFDMQEALDMVCHKIGRVINGNENNVDSWRDMAGYTTLVADRLEGFEQ
jgi:hypothetical protein